MLSIKIKFFDKERKSTDIPCIRTQVRNYEELHTTIKTHVKCDDFEVLYEDEDQDHCMLDSERTFQEACEFVRKTQIILKLSVKVGSDGTEPSKSQEVEQDHGRNSTQPIKSIKEVDQDQRSNSTQPIKSIKEVEQDQE